MSRAGLVRAAEAIEERCGGLATFRRCGVVYTFQISWDGTARSFWAAHKGEIEVLEARVGKAEGQPYRATCSKTGGRVQLVLTPTT